MSVHVQNPGTVPRGANRIALGWIAVQLLLVLLVVERYALEERRRLLPVLALAAGGAVVWRFLPVRFRPWFFLLLSAAGFVTVLGAHDAACIFGIGLTLIGIVHLPAPTLVRGILLAAVVAGLTALRASFPLSFWAVLGSIFMFRLWIYTRERRRETQPVSWPLRLSYFFLLPHACFPFFPIIDYRKFRDGFEPDDSGCLAQQGIEWILRGIVHLLAYRAVKAYLLPAPIDLIDAEYIALFLVTNYALYLRISGQFHIITGMLHLFGFALPRTHDRYFLASSLSDIWRRINIYWRDFLADHVFFPTYFALSRCPRSVAVVAGVFVTFIATWFLHSWQAFWLLGHFPLDGRDAALWLSAGLLVALNSYWQFRTAARRLVPAGDVTLGSAFRLSLQVAGTFLLVSFFWACWTVPRFPQLVAAVGQSGGFSTDHLTRPALVLAGALGLGTAAQLVVARLRRAGIPRAFRLERSPVACALSLGVLAVVASPEFREGFGSGPARVLATLTSESPTAAELGQEIEGYYEELAEANLQATPLLPPGPERSPEQIFWGEIVRRRNDVIGTEMKPGWQGTLAGASFRVNRWGMRDDDASRRRPADVHRVAVAGSSVTMGYGVPEEADFESLVERRWNEGANRRIEVLNFSTGGYVALQWGAVLREKVYSFEPQVLLYVAHQGELFGSQRHLAKCHELGYAIPFPCLHEIIRAAGITEDLSWGVTEVRLQPHAREILACIYRGIVDDCRQREIVPVWIYVPMPGVSEVPQEVGPVLVEIARGAGFEVVDLSDWASGVTEKDVMLDGHRHPNELGHRLIAEALLAALERKSGILPPE